MIHRNHAHEHVAADRVFAAVTRKFGTLYDDHDAASRRRFAFEYAQSHVPVPRVPATAKFVRVSNMVADDAMKMICSKKWMSEIVFDGLRAKQNESELEWRARVMKALDITEFDVSLYAVIAAKYEQVGFLKRLYSVLKEQRGVKKDDVLRDQIRDLMNDGMNAADIARQLSKNESFIRRVVRELKAKRQICDLVNDGMTEEAIAKRLGKKEQFISRVVRELKSEHQLLISISGGTKRDLKSEPAPGLDGALERLLRKAEATQQRRKSRGLSKP